MTMLDKLDTLINQHGLNKHTLAKQCGLPYSTIMGIYNKDYSKLKLPTLRTLSDFFGVSIDYLARDELDASGLTAGLPEHDKIVPFSSPEDEPILSSWHILNDPNRLKILGYAEGLAREQELDQTATIREFISPAAAGYVSPVMNEDYVLIPRDSSIPAGADFAVRIRGDSMEPLIRDGGRIFVSESRDLRIGDVGIFFVDGDIYCKQYVTDGHNLYLLSLNRERADADITVLESSEKTVYCFGRVLIKRIPVPEY